MYWNTFRLIPSFIFLFDFFDWFIKEYVSINSRFLDFDYYMFYHIVGLCFKLFIRFCHFIGDNKNAKPCWNLTWAQYVLPTSNSIKNSIFWTEFLFIYRGNSTGSKNWKFFRSQLHQNTKTACFQTYFCYRRNTEYLSENNEISISPPIMLTL